MRKCFSAVEMPEQVFAPRDVALGLDDERIALAAPRGVAMQRLQQAQVFVVAAGIVFDFGATEARFEHRQRIGAVHRLERRDRAIERLARRVGAAEVQQHRAERPVDLARHRRL